MSPGHKIKVLGSTMLYWQKLGAGPNIEKLEHQFLQTMQVGEDNDKEILFL